MSYLGHLSLTMSSSFSSNWILEYYLWKKGEALPWIAYHVIIQHQQEIRTSTSAILLWSLKPRSKKNPNCRAVWLELSVWMPLKPPVLRLNYEFSLFILAFCDTDYMVHVCMHIQDRIIQFLFTLHWETRSKGTYLSSSSETEGGKWRPEAEWGLNN